MKLLAGIKQWSLSERVLSPLWQNGTTAAYSRNCSNSNAETR